MLEYRLKQYGIDKNDFSMFRTIDPSGLVKDLVCLNERPMQNMEQTRQQYCDVFLNLLNVNREKNVPTIQKK